MKKFVQSLLQVIIEVILGAVGGAAYLLQLSAAKVKKMSTTTTGAITITTVICLSLLGAMIVLAETAVDSPVEVYADISVKETGEIEETKLSSEPSVQVGLKEDVKPTIEEQPVKKEVVIPFGTVEGDFIVEILPFVESISKEYNLYPSIMMAQACLESGFGQSDLSKVGKNMFGVKGNYNGSFVEYPTLEDDGKGNMYQINAKFRKYPTYEQSVRDNAEVIRNGPSFDSTFYSQAWRENSLDYISTAWALTGTYATDTNYANKLLEIIHRYGFNHMD